MSYVARCLGTAFTIVGTVAMIAIGDSHPVTVVLTLLVGISWSVATLAWKDAA